MGILFRKPADEPGAAWPAIVIGLFVAFGGVLFGYDTGTISGILEMRVWRELFAKGHVDATGQPRVSSSDESLIVSILSLGTFFGALSAAPVVDLVGRRWGLIGSTAIVFNFGVILQTAATKQPLFIAGRAFAGFGVGLISAMIPLYQSETAPKWIRGTIVGAYQLAITIGLFIASVVNNATKNRNDTGCYRIPIAVQFAWSLILVGGLLVLPETPRFLIKKGRNEDAAKALARLRRLPMDHPGLVAELAEIRANHEYELTVGTGSYLDCTKGTIGKRLLTGCSLQALQQLSGVNFIFYYVSQISLLALCRIPTLANVRGPPISMINLVQGTAYFQRAGFDNAFTIQVITNCVNMASTLPGLWLVEKLGRRGLLLFGAVGMTVAQFVVAITGTAAGTTDQAAQRAAIAFVCIYIFFFASSWGPVAWVVTGELFPLKVRAKCLSMTTATNWLLNFVIAFCTPYLVDDEHAGLGSRVFFIWGSCCALSIFFVWFFIYETKGLTLEQVDELYGIVTQAWKSNSFRPQISFKEAQVEGTAQGISIRQMSIAQEQRRASRADEKHTEVANSEVRE